MLRPAKIASNHQSAKRRSRVDLITTGDARPNAFYGIEKRHLLPGTPPVDGAHDPAYYLLINSSGLAGPWRLWSERFTAAGRWFFAGSVALFVSGINSLEMQSYVPLLYSSVLWLCALVVFLLSRPRAALRAIHTDRVCAGEVFSVEIELTNKNRTLRDWRLVPHRLPPQIGLAVGGTEPFTALKSGETARIAIRLQAGQRGVFVLRGWRVESSFPFGLLNAAQVFTQEKRLLVYPAFKPLAHLEIPTGRRHHPGGVALVSRLGESMEYLGNREYREGDNPRDIDWRATARLQKPILREYREEYFLRVAVVLDTHLPLANQLTERKAFERAVSLCAAVGDFMARQEYLVDIFAAGPNLYHLSAGRSLAYLDQILEILACIDPDREEPFETLEPEILKQSAHINAVVCLFLDWNSTRRAFCERLHNSGVGLKVIIVRDAPCTQDPDRDADWLGPILVVSRQAFEANRPLHP